MTRTEVIQKATALIEEMPIQTVARNILRDHPEFFKTLQAARSAINHARGINGASRRNGGNPKLSTIAEGIAKLKRQRADPDLSIRITGMKVLVLSDIHIPFHVPEAVAAALEHGKRAGVGCIVLNGDIIDFYRVSRFTKEIGRMPVEEELLELKRFLHLLRYEFPDARLIYKLGNHEERFRAYLLNEAKELAGLEELRFENVLGLKELGIEMVRRNVIRLGKLNLLHGHELPHGISAPVNPARGVYLRAKASTMVGHHHQISHHAESDLNGNHVGCWSLGCLCRMDPEYNRFAFLKWRHGFAVVDVEDSGRFHVQNLQIIDGSVC